MSKVHKEQVQCPHCHSIGTMEMIDEVDADINPELRERVLNAQDAALASLSATVCSTMTHSIGSSSSST